MEKTSIQTKRLVGFRIKQLRRVRNLSQEDLAEQTGMSSKFISSIERGNENPTLDTFIKLSLALNVEIHELFDYSVEGSRAETRKFLMDLLTSGSKERFDMAAKVIRAFYI
jgi:transcriptional regulator with XRE-family HTH domain